MIYIAIMKRYLFLFVMIFGVCTLIFSQTDRNTRYVAVQNTALKASAGFFANDVGTLSLGDAVTLIRDDGKWSQVRTGNLTGFVASSSLSTRRVVSSNATGVTASEIALAGKGFSPEMEVEYKRSGLNYSTVDSMEQIVVSRNDLLRFVDEGRLSRGE
jgi:uncharacterized protein YgiM (DUF1202 family)